MDSTMNVWLSGPTASGKTTLAKMLSELGFSVVQENLPAEAFRAFARDPASHCRELQEAIVRSRHSQWSQVVAPRVAFDRSIDEDIHVFCEMHHRLGYLTLDELNRLK